MRPEEWEEALLSSTDAVRRKLSLVVKEGDRRKTLGVGASGDRTTFADKLAEDELLKALRRDEVRILSEEAGFVGDPHAKTLAVVDPLDGSSNFSRGIPFYCTSVAIVEGDSVDGILAGCVRDLVSGDAYSASKGRGSRKNGEPIRSSGASELSESVVGIDLSRGGGRVVGMLAPLVAGVGRQVHFGANALELCYVAEGRTDAFVDLRGRIRITDLAAAYLIAAEAGAVITGADGEKVSATFDLTHRLSLVASANGGLHKQILELLDRRWGGS